MRVLRSQAKDLAKRLLEIPKRIPLINSIYGTVQQVVQMLNRDDGDENLKKM